MKKTNEGIFSNVNPHIELRGLTDQIIELMSWLDENWSEYSGAQIIADVDDITDEVNCLFFEGSDSSHAERFIEERIENGLGEEATVEDEVRYIKDLKYYRRELTNIKDQITGEISQYEDELSTNEKKKYVMTFESFVAKINKSK